MRESQYIDEYIDSGYTIGSFLTMKLKGAAKDYKGRYQRALEHAVERRVAAGTAFPGRTAFPPKPAPRTFRRVLLTFS